MRLQDRTAMSTFARSRNHERTIIATCVFAALVWALALTGSPQWHQRVHADANKTDHTCAVTLIVSGSYDHAALLPLISAPRFGTGFSEIPGVSSTWVQPLIFKAHVFAHAPPALRLRRN
jgi:hypothetical protein